MRMVGEMYNKPCSFQRHCKSRRLCYIVVRTTITAQTHTNKQPQLLICYSSIVVRHSEGPPLQGDSMGATENAGFNAEVQQNLGLDFVTKQHKLLRKLQPV